MKNNVRNRLAIALTEFLRPLVRILLRCGIDYSEFNSIAKSVYVDTASREYGLRGRLTNVSRVALITGLSRREVRQIRSVRGGVAWTPGMESSPVNSIIHFWRFDSDFCDSPGKGRPLPLEGEKGFEGLIRRYAPEASPSLIKQQLIDRGAAREDSADCLRLLDQYSLSNEVYEEVIQNMFFSLNNLADTLDNNSRIIARDGSTPVLKKSDRRFERFVWTDRLDPQYLDSYRAWLAENGQRFLERADDWIGAREIQQGDWNGDKEPTVLGFGIYYFERKGNNQASEYSESSRV